MNGSKKIDAGQKTTLFTPKSFDRLKSNNTFEKIAISKTTTIIP